MPKGTPPSKHYRLTEGMRKAAQDLCAIIDDRLPLLTSKPHPDLLRRQLAAGGLARARGLLEGLVLLADGGRPDVVGVLVRTLYETCIVSLYVILGDDAAAFHVMDDYARSVRILSEKYGFPLSQQTQAWRNRGPRTPQEPPPDPERRLNYEQIAARVGKLLEAASDPTAMGKRATELYDTVYRGESLMSSHAGLGSFSPYVDWHAEPWRIVDRPQRRPKSADDPSVIGVLLTAHLAGYVFREFGLRPDSAYEVFRQVQALPDDGSQDT
jgi:hypothetical protein